MAWHKRTYLDTTEAEKKKCKTLDVFDRRLKKEEPEEIERNIDYEADYSDDDDEELVVEEIEIK